MLDRSHVQDALGAADGLLRLEPAWVPRTFMHPGRRLRLHPDDLYALGAHRGGIDERWFSSTTNADNGPGTPADEGLSYVRTESGQRFLLKRAVEVAGDLPAQPTETTEPHGFREQWVCYGTGWYSAKELTVLPKRMVTVTDSAAYGVILTQGNCTFGSHRVSTPAMIRFGDMTEDELFVSAEAAQKGVRIENASASDPLVLLKHFGPGNPDAEPLRQSRRRS